MTDSVGPVSIVVLTYKRPTDLSQLLPDLDAQIENTQRRDIEIVVVDNDPEASARQLVTGSASPRTRYVHEPAPGIAHARNRALDETSNARLLIFIDDDERPSETWLSSLLETHRRTGAAAVVGPVHPDYEVEPDPWIVAGGFFVRKQFPSGTKMPAAGTGNLLLDLADVRRLHLRFDERFGLTGGSDTLFTRALLRGGGDIIWCAEASVLDKVPVARLSRRWVLQRAYRSGNTWARTTVEPSQAGRGVTIARLQMTGQGSVRVVGGALRVVFGTVTRSSRHQARGGRTVARGLGMVSGAWGLAYQEYRRKARAQ